MILRILPMMLLLKSENLFNHYILNLTETDNRLEEEMTTKTKELEDCKKILRDTIPIENQCYICHGFTHKKQVLSQCGHTQYYNNCIKKITKCSLCNAPIVNVVKIYT